MHHNISIRLGAFGAHIRLNYYPDMIENLTTY
ncbi:hypothetical protein FG05_35115 [Fusarium graminearum]|nr:hypothetical protein FG05_35115 [Fusarium graminearum]